MRKLIVMAAFAALLVGCQKQSEEVEVSPLEKMENHLAEVQGKRVNMSHREWTDISYDVQKTDSLVSPYTATVSADIYEFTKEEGGDPGNRELVEIVLGYQGKNWVITQLKSKEVPYMEDSSGYYTDKIFEEMTESDYQWSKINEDLKLK